MNDHIHKIGVWGSKSQYRFGCECGRSIQYIDAMLYVERVKGDVVGREYWVRLRTLLDQLRHEKKVNKIFNEGYTYPTEN